MKRIYINDFVLNVVVVLLCIATPVVLFFTGRNEEKTAVISYDGKTEKTISLDEECVYKTHGVEIKVENGQAFVIYSDCPDGLCMRMKKAKNSGDSIICVPNRVSIKIVGQARKDGADIVAG